MRFDVGEQIVRHSHNDWSCNVTDESVFGRRALSIFPLAWRDFGSSYEISAVVIVTKKSLASNEIIKQIASYDQMIDVSLVREIMLPEKTAFKISVSAKHYKRNGDILRTAFKHRVPVNFICFSEGAEVFSLQSPNTRRLANFAKSLERIGTFRELGDDSILSLGSYSDYYYYYLLRSLGITKKLDFQIFNIIRNLIARNGSFSKKCLTPYAKQLKMSPAYMSQRFWNICWKVLPVITSINMLKAANEIEAPCPYVGKQTAPYVC